MPHVYTWFHGSPRSLVLACVATPQLVLMPSSCRPHAVLSAPLSHAQGMLQHSCCTRVHAIGMARASRNMHATREQIIEAALASKLLAIGGVLILHDAWPIGRARLALEAVQATVEFLRANYRFLEPVPASLPGFAVFVKRFPDNRQWDHFINFRWDGLLPVGKSRYWNRSPNFANPACQHARNIKPFKWCKSKVRDAASCERDLWVRDRCNATCNGC